MFNEKKEKAIEIFHEYLAVCDQLYAAKEKQGKGDPEEFSNALEKNGKNGSWSPILSTIFY